MQQGFPKRNECDGIDIAVTVSIQTRFGLVQWTFVELKMHFLKLWQLEDL